MAKAVLPHMKKQGGGSIVNISTMETRKARPGEGAYAIPKAALEMATRQLAFELGKIQDPCQLHPDGLDVGRCQSRTRSTNWAKSAGQPLDAILGGVVSQIPLVRDADRR